MDERELAESRRRVRAGSLDRRQFARTLVGLGLTAPMIAELLGPRPGHAQPRRSTFTPTRRGGGGELKTLWWQAPTILNPHLATGAKDADASRIFYEGLVSFDPDGNIVPDLVAEVPTIDNSGLARDGLSVTLKLKKGVQWHDGKPFTADDVVFTWEYVMDPATAATTSGAYRDIARIDKPDQHTVKIVYKSPNPFWAKAFSSIIPRHVFAPFKGARSREAPANLKPVGTGPYRYADFKPGDLVRAEVFPGYHEANWPFFDRLEMKGGGDAVSAARAVIQTGEYDFAWNMQVEDDVLRRMEQGGKGRLDIAWGGGIEQIFFNFSDPLREIDGERSSVKAPHPFLTDPAVRTALSLLVDRASIQEQIYGRHGQATANYLNAPPTFRSKNTRWEFSPEKAARVLDDAGWKRAGDGVRAKDGKRLRMLFQTSINAPRQKTQAIVKQAAAKIGIEVEVKAVVPAVYFSTDPANADTLAHFTADLQMYSLVNGSPDPQLFLQPFVSWEIAQKENKWAGRNSTRWRHDDYDRMYKAAETEMDPVKRAALFIRMNDMLVQTPVIVPFMWRGTASAVANRLRGTEISGWDSTFWNLAHWYREA
ncbi:MAG: peptide ABC transporter substrate-binding protein [Candidatus Rokuibacteriota bacterium]|nr:MAG: peptide ABC transporter substrate-binding protein [Candidatus Rokubacteria bacterium]